MVKGTKGRSTTRKNSFEKVNGGKVVKGTKGRSTTRKNRYEKVNALNRDWRYGVTSWHS